VAAVPLGLLPLWLGHLLLLFHWYVQNGQRDIIGITDNAGTVVVSYTYDAWGNPIATTGSHAATVGVVNPLKYRRYYYDVETGWYYLNSRYYDPAIGRFINADGYASTGQGVLGGNMFAYCLNNPTNRVDPSGYLSQYTVIGLDDVVIRPVGESSENPAAIPSDLTGVGSLIHGGGGGTLYPSSEGSSTHTSSSGSTHGGGGFDFIYCGRNDTEYYWWGYRVYIDGPTCKAMVTWGRGGTAVTAAAGFFGGIPGLTVGAIITNIFLAEMDILNQGKGVYYDVYWISPVLPGGSCVSIVATMRPQ